MKRMSEDMCPSVYTNFPIDTTVDAHALDSAVITGYLEATSRIEVPTVEVIPKDQYEARLKADKIAMLEELKKEIEDRRTDYDKDSKAEYDIYCAYDRCSRIIQEKINALRG